MSMASIDWYLVATPLFALTVALSLLALKFSLKGAHPVPDQMWDELRSKQAEHCKDKVKPAVKRFQVLGVLWFLIRNHTVVQVVAARKSENKLPMLLSLAVIAATSIISPSMYLNSLVGIPLVLTFVGTRICSEADLVSSSIMDQQAQNYGQMIKARSSTKRGLNTNQLGANRMLYIAYAALSIGLSLFLTGYTFKNYSNSFLSGFLLRITVNCVLDLTVVRLGAFLLISAPLSFSEKVRQHMQKESLRELYSAVKAELKDKRNAMASRLSPQKLKSLSPSKVPKAIRDNHDQNPEVEAIEAAIEIARRIKNGANQKRDLMVNNLALLEQNSLNNLVDDLEAQGRGILDEPGNAAVAADQQQSWGGKTKRKETDLIIVEFKGRPENQPEGYQERQESQDQEVFKKKEQKFLHSNLDFEEEIYKRQCHPAASQQAHDAILNLVKISGPEPGDVDFEPECHKNLAEEPEYNTMSVERHDQLRIYHHDKEEEMQIEEIDQNSPQRRRNQSTLQFDSSQFKLNKKAKHFAGNSKRRVIKCSSGEPYLEYLPNMLTKDHTARHKKSQPICPRPTLEVEEQHKNPGRKARSKKEPKFAFMGDENQYPGALEIEDI